MKFKEWAITFIIIFVTAMILYTLHKVTSRP